MDGTARNGTERDGTGRNGTERDGTGRPWREGLTAAGRLLPRGPWSEEEIVSAACVLASSLARCVGPEAGRGGGGGGAKLKSSIGWFLTPVSSKGACVFFKRLKKKRVIAKKERNWFQI